jgi:hypothetical protein
MAVEYIWVQSENGATMMARQPAPDPKGLFGEEGITFKDVLDIINPLQQLPIIGSIYRELTGDTIKPGARLIGGGIYGLGIGGVVSAALNNAVEHDTGKDLGATAIAMLKGESLDDMRAAQAAKNAAATQVAATSSNVYYLGGADPIDPTSLPAGAKLVEYAGAPVAGRNATQYAALPTDPAAAAATATAGAPAWATGATGAPAAAPTADVAVSPLPPTINPPAAAASNAPITSGALGDAVAGNSVPSMAGMTGLSGSSRLPTAGAITPAAAAVTANAAESQINANAASSATASAAAQSTLAAAQGSARSADGYFAVPARTNNVVPRQPVAINPVNVGTQPLALSTPERRTTDTVKVSAAAAPAAPTPTPTPSALATTPAPAAQSAAAQPQPELAGAMVAPAQVPEAMMRALDKYDALMKSRRNSGGQVDRNL